MIGRVAARGYGIGAKGWLGATVALVGAAAHPEASEAQSRDLSLRMVPSGWHEPVKVIGVWTEPSEEPKGGLSVISLLAEGPAEESGVRKGDIIVAAGGHQLDQPLDDEAEEGVDDLRNLPNQRLRALVQAVPEGEALQIELLRDGERVSLAVTPGVMGYDEFGERVTRDAAASWMDLLDLDRLAESLEDLSAELRLRVRGKELGMRIRDELERWRDQYEHYRSRPRAHSLDTSLALVPSRSIESIELHLEGLRGLGSHGLEMVDLNPGLGSYFGVDEGVLIADVESRSPLGLEPGDVVISVDGRQVDDADELRRILRSYTDDEEIVFRIQRSGHETSVEGSIR
ncbi:MAG: PDZ domain-containing protein [Gemmatimonadetes bacterium]|nr:PDZ domain-containing protein [Gemmatimonadota bacterium]MCY3942890.1 PDZ domain-containing protein [Gemmatimonadota bacterium]